MTHTQSCRAYCSIQLVNTLYRFWSITADRVMLKINHNTRRTQDWTAQGFIACLARLSIILCYSNSDLFKNGCLKSFLKAKVKSQVINCINHGFQSDGHCQCSQPRCTLLCCDPCVSLELRTVTHFKLMVPPLQKLSIHILNAVRKRIECQIQWRMKWTILLTFSE